MPLTWTTALLDAGNYPERMCAPMADYFLQRGGEVRVNSRLQRIDLNSDGTVQSFRLADGSAIEGDLYFSAMPGASSAMNVGTCPSPVCCRAAAVRHCLECCSASAGRLLGCNLAGSCMDWHLWQCPGCQPLYEQVLHQLHVLQLLHTPCVACAF